MTKGPAKVSPYSIPGIIANLAAGQVAIAQGLKGPSYCTTSACSSGAHAIGEASEWIRRGKVDVMVAGGTEATITPVGIAGFEAMFALSKRNDDPQHASRPFDRGRDGFVCGEGGGILVLESLTHAKRRGATIYAEVTGYGASTRRLPHHPAGAGRTRARSGRCAWRSKTRSVDAGRDRLRERARHVDADRRRRGVARHRGGLRRARDRQEAVGQLDQVDDGAPPRRRRRGRDGGLRARDARGPRPADDQPRRLRIPSARSTTWRTPRASGASATR